MKWKFLFSCNALRKNDDRHQDIKKDVKDVDVKDDVTEFDVDVEEARMATLW